jgi:hypothetical protein
MPDFWLYEDLGNNLSTRDFSPFGEGVVVGRCSGGVGGDVLHTADEDCDHRALLTVQILSDQDRLVTQTLHRGRHAGRMNPVGPF